MKFLDASVIIRFLTRDDEVKATAAYAFLDQVQNGEEEVFLSETIVAEVVYVLSSRRSPYRLDHEEIRARLMPVLTMRSLHIPQKTACLRALELYAESPFLDFGDAIAVAHMEQQGIGEILSYDHDYDRITGIRRVEP